MEKILDFATRLVIDQVNEESENNKKIKFEKITKEQIEEAEETYIDLIEEFIDNIFESDSILSRKTWEEQVSKKESWIV